MPEWSHDCARYFFDRRRDAGYEEDTDQSWDILVAWLDKHLAGRDEIENPTASVQHWNGDQVLLLLSKKGIVQIAVDGRDVTTRYYGPPLRGTYTETYHWDEERGAHRLVVRYHHDDLDGEIAASALRSKIASDLDPIRTLLFSWATAPNNDER